MARFRFGSLSLSLALGETVLITRLVCESEQAQTCQETERNEGCSVVLCCPVFVLVLQNNFALAREYVAGINREVALIGLDGWIDRSIDTYIHTYRQYSCALGQIF